MAERTCAVTSCGKPARKRGWCYTHYSRWYRRGDVNHTKQRHIGVDECSIDGCTKKLFGRGWCVMHWERWRRNGDPLARQRIRGDLGARLWSQVTKTDACWLWTGYLNHQGYGTLWDGEMVAGAHRVAYRLEVGAIPEDLVLDHLCRVRNCVNPAHLEPVTSAENTRRGVRDRKAQRLSRPEPSASQ
jgi:hypothetical protein